MTTQVRFHSYTGTATRFYPPSSTDAVREAVGRWSRVLNGTITYDPASIRTAASQSNEERLFRERFARLMKTWRNETGLYSVDTKKITHPAYLMIIGMGRQAIPMILADLQQRGGHWYQALEAILGYNPIQMSSPVGLSELKERWLAWGRQEGYLS